MRLAPALTARLPTESKCSFPALSGRAALPRICRCSTPKRNAQHSDMEPPAGGARNVNTSGTAAALETSLPAPSPMLLDSAVIVYGELCAEARSLGIPERALPPRPVPLTVVGLQAATHHLQLIIASRLSSNL